MPSRVYRCHWRCPPRPPPVDPAAPGRQRSRAGSAACEHPPGTRLSVEGSLTSKLSHCLGTIVPRLPGHSGSATPKAVVSGSTALIVDIKHTTASVGGAPAAPFSLHVPTNRHGNPVPGNDSAGDQLDLLGGAPG